MTHISSAAEHLNRNRGGSKKQDKPRPDSNLGILFDRLHEAKGGGVTVDDLYKPGGPSRGTAIMQLTDFYGLNIRILRQGSVKRGPSIYFLAGYWNGSTYIDYTCPKE